MTGSRLRCSNGDPKLGGVCTITDIEIVDAYQGPRGPGLLLAELKNPGDRLWFDPQRFVALELVPALKGVAQTQARASACRSIATQLVSETLLVSKRPPSVAENRF